MSPVDGVVVPITVQREYEKNPLITPEDILKLRGWLNRQPHLPSEHITDLDLILVYHCCDRSAEVAKNVLDLHFTLRTLVTKFFLDRDADKKMEKVLRNAYFVPLPMPTLQGERVIFNRLLDPDPKNFHPNDLLRGFMMMLDLWQLEEGTCPGVILVVDFQMATFSHLARIEITTVQQAIYFLQEAMLFKLKGVHYINAPPVMDKFLMMIKPFIKKSLFSLLHIYPPGDNSIYDIVPQEAFPKDCGGQYKDSKTISEDLWIRLKKNRQYFLEENKKRVQESLRPGKPKTMGTIFGIEGSFKKLEID